MVAEAAAVAVVVGPAVVRLVPVVVLAMAGLERVRADRTVAMVGLAKPREPEGIKETKGLMHRELRTTTVVRIVAANRIGHTLVTAAAGLAEAKAVGRTEVDAGGVGVVTVVEATSATTGVMVVMDADTHTPATADMDIPAVRPAMTIRTSRPATPVMFAVSPA